MAAAVSTAASAVSGQKREPEKGRKQSAICDRSVNGMMPCGPLQSMQIVALASANPFAGALSMLAFSLGTVPLMLGLGSFVAMLGKRLSAKVMETGAVLVVVLGLAMLSQGGNLSGLFYSGMEWNAAGQQVYAVSGEAEPVQVLQKRMILVQRLRMEFRS